MEKIQIWLDFECLGPSHTFVARCIRKHPSNIRHPADIPLAKVLIELRCSFKHKSHIRDTADIPLANVLVELRCSTKHVIPYPWRCSHSIGQCLGWTEMLQKTSTPYSVNTMLTSHWPMSWLNRDALQNWNPISVTLLTSHWPMSWLNWDAPQNINLISVTLPTFQRPMSSLKSLLK